MSKTTIITGKWELPPNTLRFTFDLPYGICVSDEDISEGISIPISELEGRIIIYPPSTYEKRYIYEAPGKKVWNADVLHIDVKAAAVSRISRKEIEVRFTPIAEEYLISFLRNCRTITKQFQIDLRQKVTTHITYFNEEGKVEKCGYLTLTTIHIGEPPSVDSSSWKRIAENLISQAEIPFHLEAFLDAKLYKSNSDFRMAVVSSAIGIEAVLNRYLKKTLGKSLVSTGRTTESQVDKYIAEISNRILIPVGLGLTSSIERELLGNCVNTWQLRNDIVHGKKKFVSRKEAQEAINSFEQLMSTKDIQEVLN